MTFFLFTVVLHVMQLPQCPNRHFCLYISKMCKERNMKFLCGPSLQGKIYTGTVLFPNLRDTITFFIILSSLYQAWNLLYFLDTYRK